MARCVSVHTTRLPILCLEYVVSVRASWSVMHSTDRLCNCLHNVLQFLCICHESFKRMHHSESSNVWRVELKPGDLYCISTVEHPQGECMSSPAGIGSQSCALSITESHYIVDSHGTF
jgi:hypothetical protein